MNSIIENIDEKSILHISVAGICDKFYNTLLKKMKAGGVGKQLMYIPYQSGKDEDLSRFQKEDDGIEYLLADIKTNSDRIFYLKKIRKYYSYLDEHIKIGDYDMVHAHHMFSDGGVAYEVFRNYGIPYGVSVRSTDVDVFMKYFPHIKGYAMQILEHASFVICLNDAIKERLMNYCRNDLKEQLREKTIILPNGVDDFWIGHTCKHIRKENEPFTLIQVGRLNKRKNPMVTLQAAKKLIDDGHQIELYFVGKGPLEEKIRSYAGKHGIKNKVHLIGFIGNKEELLKYYRKADCFVLPSLRETFGIAYVEALTQGIPVIYTKGQGIDGFIPEDAGRKINAKDPLSVVDAVENIMQQDFDFLSEECVLAAKVFNWDSVIGKMIGYYKKIINNSLNEGLNDF